MKQTLKSLILEAILFIGFFPLSLFAQGSSAFTYQGQLRDGGTNAAGAYTMTFKLYDAGAAGSQIGGNIVTTPTLFNGLFTVNLDFGVAAFDGSPRWLDITVKFGSSPAETLSPRVQVLPSPYALFAGVAATVTNHAIMNSHLANSAVATSNLQNNAVTLLQLASGAVTNRNLTANAVNGTNIAGGQVVKSINGLSDAVTVVGNMNMIVITNGTALSLSAMVPTVETIDTGTIITVPTNFSSGWRFIFEVWGAGGGGGGQGGSGNNGTNQGGNGGGGGGGGYAKGVLIANPGDAITVTVGDGGVGGTVGLNRGAGTNGVGGGSGSNGGTTSVTCNGITISATGGGGGGGNGGAASGIGNTGSSGIGGNPGWSNQTANSGIWVSGYHGTGFGAGGSGANGGPGGTLGSSSVGETPGGGGGGGGLSAGTASGYAGAPGRVIIWY